MTKTINDDGDGKGDRQIDIEIQRSQMQDILRGAEMALMIAVTPTGIVTVYLNLNSIERRGLAELLRDTAPRFEIARPEDLG